MKKFKKLIPALCMLLVSAVMLGSTTYAWFSINNKVTATGMNVSAKANTQYFVVSDTTTFGSLNEVSLTSHEGGVNDEAKVYPASYLKDAAAVTALKAKLTDEKYSDGSSPAEGTWYTANSAKYNTVEGGDGDKLVNAKQVGLAAGDYFISYTFYVSLAAKSEDFTGRLIITAAADTSVNEAVNAVIKINGKSAKDGTAADTVVTTGIFGETDDKVTTTGNYYLSASDTAPSYVTVTVYIYVDGTNANVIDEKIGELTGNFKLTVEGTTAA